MDGSIICIGLAEIQLFEKNGFHAYNSPYDFILNCIEPLFEKIHFLVFLLLYNNTNLTNSIYPLDKHEENSFQDYRSH